MKSASTLLLALAGCFAACGMTYEFAKDGSGPYGVWSKSMEKQPVPAALEAKAGVNGSGALVIADAGKKSFKIAVNDLFLLPGKSYRIGGWVRTENLKARRARFVLHNAYWRREVSTKNFPGSTKGKWVKFEETAVLQPSSNGYYTFCVHVDQPAGGKLEISSPYVEEIKPQNQLTVLNYSFTAKTDPEQKSGGDPGFRKLTDGISLTDAVPERARGGKSVLWRHRENGGKGPVITFNFATPVKIEKAKIHYFRWKRSYGIKEIRLVGVSGSERQVIGNVMLKHPYEKPEKDPFCSSAEITAASEQKFSTVELHFIPTGGYLSLNEVDFFGKAEPVPEAKPEESAGHPLSAELKARPANGLQMFRKNGMIVLENDYVIYVLDPGYTGSVNFAYDRESKTNLALYAKPNSGYGPMFCDRVYPGDYDIRDMYRYLAYEAEIVADTPEKKQVRLTGTGRTGIFRNVRMEKVYTLTADSPVLKVEHAIHNGMDNVIPLRYGYWMCGGAQSPNGYRLVIPGSLKVEAFPYIRQFSVRDISSGWMAAMDGKSDSGLGLLMPYDLLSEFYFWGENRYRGTMEFKLGIYPIKAGEALRFETALCPFSKIGVPEKVTKTAAVSFGDPLQSPQLKIQMFDPREHTLRLSGGFMERGAVAFRPFFSKKIAAGTRRFECSFQLPPGQGTLVLKAELLRNDTPVMSAETSCIIGKASGTWKLTPDCPRKPDINASRAKANLDFHSLEVVTPHIEWGKPYAGGRPKVLALNYASGIREMVEFAERFDIGLTTNFTGGLWSLSGYVMSLGVKDCIGQLSEKLKNRYDVILVSGNLWQLLPENVSSAILEQVAAGTGLIVISPSGHPKTLQQFFVPAKRNVRVKGEWKAVPGKTIFTGIPFESMPPVRVTRFEIRNGELLATAGKAPLAVRFRHGKGQIFLAAYQAKLPIERKKSTFFLPSVTYDDPKLSWHYYEYQHMFLARMVYAAAGKTVPFEVSGIAAAPDALTLEIASAEEKQVEIEVILRDKFSRPAGTKKQRAELKKGTNRISVPLPKATLQGRHFADTVISTAQGKAWWGSASFENEAAAKFTGIKVPDQVFRQEDKIAPEINISGSGEVVAKLYDNHGNVFAEGTGTAPVLPLADCLSPACKLEISLFKDGRETDRFTKDLYLWRKPDTNFFQIAQGWPGVGEKAPLYLAEFYTGIMHRYYHVTCTSGSTSSWDTEGIGQAYRRNDVLVLSRETGPGTGGKYPFDRDQKIKDKFDLVRKPCLSDPAVLERIRQGSKKKPSNAAGKYGAILGAGADEANMFSGWDGCFSPHCMKELRIWLKESYGSLEKLNAAWKTEFRSWDEVVPMTQAEARKHGSYAPWVDHRTFNDRQRAAAIGIQTASIEKNTGLWLSLSGTSETNPWNAWDYYRIMPHMKALAGYFGEQTIQHRSFAKSRLFSMPWIGYDIPYDEHNMNVSRALMNGVTGLNFYGTFYLNPDWTVPPAGVQLKKVLDRYLNGKADAIMHFDAMVYPIAFHYSPASIKVDYMEGQNELRKSSTLGFRNILSDCALNYNYLAYGEIEKGDFGKYRAVFLPVSMALSDAEIKNLSRFVRDGGVLIADLGAGRFDEHGVRRENRPELLELFGLEGFGTIRKVKGTLKGSGQLGGLALPVENAETGIRNGKAVPCGKLTSDLGTMDAVFVHRFGKGKTVYLAADLAGTLGNQGALRYTGKHAANTAAVRDFFNRFFAELNIAPVVRAPTLRSTELLMRERDGAYIVGFVRNIDQTRNSETAPTRHTIVCSQKFHAWDLLEQRSLGYGDRFDYEFGPVTQSIWVLLPYKPELTARANGRGRAWKIELALKADTRRFTRHILNIRLKDKNGKVNEAYSRKLVMDNGKCEVDLKLPLNRPADGWVFEAEDVLTGCQTRIELK